MKTPPRFASGGREDAVEHVDAAVHGLEDVERRAHAHQVAGPVPRHQLGGQLAHVLPLGRAPRPPPARRWRSRRRACPTRHCALSRRRSAKSAPCTMPKSDWGESPRASRLRAAQRWVRSRAARAVARSAHGDHALVEHHHDVAADGHLRLDAELGAQQHRPPVDVALEERPLLGHLARVGQREDLVSAGVGEHRAGPAHEPVDAAHPPKHLRPRAQQEVVGVGEKDLRPGRGERLRRLRLHRGLRPHRHEDGRLDLAVKRAERRGPRPRAAGLRVDAEIEPGRSHAS